MLHFAIIEWKDGEKTVFPVENPNEVLNMYDLILRDIKYIDVASGDRKGYSEIKRIYEQ